MRAFESIQSPTDPPHRPPSAPPPEPTPSARSRHGGSPKRQLGVALVGLGYYATHQLARALQATQYCKLAGIVTGSPEKIPQWQQRYDIPDTNVYDYETMHQIANNDAIDVVYIVLPTSLHAQYAVIAANAGKHVWCEKPLAMNGAECQRMIDACHRNRVQLATGYRMQHEPNTRTIIDYASSRPYGAIRNIKALAGYNGTGGGWRMNATMGGGALYDMGVYSINAIRYASGQEPILVQSARQWSTRPELFSDVDEHTEFELAFASGIKAYGRTSVGEDANVLRVDCERGWYELAPMQAYNGVQGRTSDGKRLAQPVDDQQALQMDNDARCILEQHPVRASGQDGMRDIQLVEAIIQAAASGRPVQLT